MEVEDPVEDGELPPIIVSGSVLAENDETHENEGVGMEKLEFQYFTIMYCALLCSIDFCV
jgi:hypothetical protein